MQAGVLKRTDKFQVVPKVLLSSEPVKAKRTPRAPRQVKRDPVAAVMAMVELRDHMRGGPARDQDQACGLRAVLGAGRVDGRHDVGRHARLSGAGREAATSRP